MRQACTQCHNSRLDQTISRARFNIDLNASSNLSGGVLTSSERDAEIALAINKLQLPAEDVCKMPPESFRTLDPAELDLVISYLCSQKVNPISRSDDANGVCSITDSPTASCIDQCARFRSQLQI